MNCHQGEIWFQSKIFRFQHSSTSSLRRLALSRIPVADDGIPSESERISGKSEPHSDQIPRRTVTDEVTRWIWPICCHQLLVGFSIVLSPFLNLPPSPQPIVSFVHSLRHYKGPIFRSFLNLCSSSRLKIRSNTHIVILKTIWTSYFVLYD